MSLASTSMIWNGQGPVMIGTYDPVKGRPEMGFLTNLYSVGCGTVALLKAFFSGRTGPGGHIRCHALRATLSLRQKQPRA